MKDYCVQNGGDCSTCSLVNYGRDCRNNPIKEKAGEAQESREESTETSASLEEILPEAAPAVKDVFRVCWQCLSFDSDLNPDSDVCPICGEDGFIKTVSRREFFRHIAVKLITEGEARKAPYGPASLSLAGVFPVCAKE